MSGVLSNLSLDQRLRRLIARLRPLGDSEIGGTPDGTTFLRGDLTWAVPAGGGGGGSPTDLSYTPATRVLASSTGTDATLPLVGTDAGLMSAADKTKLDGIAAGADVNVPTDLSYTAATRVLASSTGTDATLPLVGADAGLMSAADKTKLDGIASGADVNVPTDLSYTAATRVLASSTGVDATLPLFTATEAGLVPLSGGGTTNFLRADGNWAAPSGGGGGSGLTEPQVQARSFMRC